VLKEEGQRASEDLCKQVRSEEFCAGTDFCEWRGDCRQCSNFTTNRECVSREFCEWDQGSLAAYPITSVDLVFVVAALLCELWTTGRLLFWDRPGSTPGNIILVICFIADVGFTVGKLFPTTYLCRSLDCAKITHNCVMTLASFLFSAFECHALYVMTKETSSGGNGRTGTGMVKLLELALCLAYIVYESPTTEPPPGETTALIVVACLAEVLLICFEGYTVFKYDIKVLPE